MKKYFIFLSITFLTLINVYSQTTVLLQEGEIVKFELCDSLNSKTSKVGDLINFTVAENVVIDSIIVIKQGSPAYGKIVSIKEADFAGIEGELEFSIDYTFAVNGKHIGIRSFQELEGKSMTKEVLVAAILLHPLFLVFKGHDVTIEKGTVFSAYVDNDYEIEL